MTKYISHQTYYEHYEYHGGTMIERIRKRGKNTVLHDWIIFDSVEEASDFFNCEC